MRTLALGIGMVVVVIVTAILGVGVATVFGADDFMKGVIYGVIVTLFVTWLWRSD